MPWLFVPVLWAFTVDFQGLLEYLLDVGQITQLEILSDTTLAFVPLCAWLAHDYGQAGLRAAAVGGAPLLVGVSTGVTHGLDLQSLADVSVYASGLILGRLVHDAEWRSAFERHTAHPAIPVAVILLAPVIVASPTIGPLSFYLSGSAFLLFVPFLLGLRSRGLSIALWSVALAIVASTALELTVRRWSGPAGVVDYGQIHPKGLIYVTLAWLCGERIARLSRSDTVEYSAPREIIAFCLCFILLFAACFPIRVELVWQAGDGAINFVPVRSLYVTCMLGLLFGLRWRPVPVWVVFVVILFWTLLNAGIEPPPGTLLSHAGPEFGSLHLAWHRIATLPSYAVMFLLFAIVGWEVRARLARSQAGEG